MPPSLPQLLSQSDRVEVARGDGLNGRPAGDTASPSAVVADGEDGAVLSQPDRVPVARRDGQKVGPRNNVAGSLVRPSRRSCCIVRLTATPTEDEAADDGDADNPLVAAGLDDDIQQDEGEDVPPTAVDESLAGLPTVQLRHDAVPEGLQPARFLELMIRRVIDTTPIDRHEDARDRLAAPL